MEANCVSSRINQLYFGNVERGLRWCYSCKLIQEYYGASFSVFNSKLNICVDSEDNTDCMSELQEYADDDNLYDARDNERTTSIIYPAIVIDNRAYIAISNNKLKELTYC